MHFDPITNVSVFSHKVEDTALQQFLLISLYLCDSIFSRIVWSNKLHNYAEGICSNVYQGNRQKTWLQRGKNASLIT